MATRANDWLSWLVAVATVGSVVAGVVLFGINVQGSAVHVDSTSTHDTAQVDIQLGQSCPCSNSLIPFYTFVDVTSFIISGSRFDTTGSVTYYVCEDLSGVCHDYCQATMRTIRQSFSYNLTADFVSSYLINATVLTSVVQNLAYGVIRDTWSIYSNLPGLSNTDVDALNNCYYTPGYVEAVNNISINWSAYRDHCAAPVCYTVHTDSWLDLWASESGVVSAPLAIALGFLAIFQICAFPRRTGHTRDV